MNNSDALTNSVDGEQQRHGSTPGAISRGTVRYCEVY